MQAGWHDMGDKAAQELGSGEPENGPVAADSGIAFGSGALQPDSHAGGVVGNDAFGRNGAAANIARKVVGHAATVLIPGADFRVPLLAAEFIEQVDALLHGHAGRQAQIAAGERLEQAGAKLAAELRLQNPDRQKMLLL